MGKHKKGKGVWRISLHSKTDLISYRVAAIVNIALIVFTFFVSAQKIPENSPIIN